MCLGVLSHIMHPSPDFPELKFGEGEKLKGIVGVAPWVSFNLDWPSEKKNRYKDLVSHYAGGKWAHDYLAGKPTTPYAEPLTAPAGWWKNSKVEQVLVVSGSNEILIDSIDEFVEKFKVGHILRLLQVLPSTTVPVFVANSLQSPRALTTSHMSSERTKHISRLSSIYDL